MDESLVEQQQKAPSNPTTKDPILQKKHDSMLERLSNLHSTRLHNKSSDSASRESTQTFLTKFHDSKHAIDTELANCRQTAAANNLPALLKSRIDGINASVADLEKLVAENSYFLPSYDVRSSLKTVSDLKQAVESLTFELIPKKKFSFKNKTAKREQPVPIYGGEIQKLDSVAKMSVLVRDSPGFRGKEGEVLTKHFNSSELGEYTIADLKCCEVRLTGCVRALFVHRLKNCKVYAGPVLGSILFEEAEDCVFVLASHQIRIHKAKRCDFYLRVRSRPIIEDSSSVRFARYCLSYDGIEKDLKESRLDEETGNWANVDDFRWLRAVQSPNWSILPESERIGIIKIANSDNVSNSENGCEEI